MSVFATAPTYCDQSGVWRTVGNKVIDTRDGKIQCASLLDEGPFNGSPENAAREFLVKHQDWVGYVPSVENLKAVRTVESPMAIM